jgi:hypothetical protein
MNVSSSSSSASGAEKGAGTGAGAGASAKASAVLLDKFPAASEDPGFARPLVPYDCGPGPAYARCGPGTKRTPKSSCPGKPGLD